MQPKSPKLLEDIQRAAERIAEYIAGRELEDYIKDSMVRSAVERQFEIIGEALNRLSKLDPDTTGRISEWRRIISFRNALSHGYDLVDDQVVWDAIMNKLPKLRSKVEALLGEEEGAG